MSDFKGKKNIYLCNECGHGFVSLDQDSGTTPFMTACRNPECEKLAYSLLYLCPQESLAEVKPALIWVVPTGDQLAKMSESTQHHVKMGGLISKEWLTELEKESIH